MVKGLKETAKEMIRIQKKGKVKIWFTEACEKATEQRRKVKVLCLTTTDQVAQDKYTAAKKKANKTTRSEKKIPQ
ncbi:unnamed protein product [Nezara viridula]|uniref:Uncharacterized protein n=1 Tax=Nezara viridula TaxID=85310 RepID=A0A9P0HT07_NEZVI|nr:unnamed protein product [Nezara viridula]